MIGLGKLGLPIAVAMETRGHTVRGYDVNPAVAGYIEQRSAPYREADLNNWLQDSRVKLLRLPDLIMWADILFVAVQTPHGPEYEGITRLPGGRQDFDYQYLIKAVEDTITVQKVIDQHTPIVIISTVLPGTLEREIYPLRHEKTQLAYNPFFIAMGTAISDFLKPEFVLLGTDQDETAKTVTTFYKTIHDRPVFRTSVRNAELIKVIYNTFISTKIAFINTVMELCHKIGSDVDVVADALAIGTDRLISAKYLRGGMGDGGGCHPRDNIALSWLARKTSLSYDWFEHIMTAREKQTDWLASFIVAAHADWPELPVYLWGTAFKAETNLEIGSCAVLLSRLLEEYGIPCEMADPHVPTRPNHLPNEPALIFIGVNHEAVARTRFVHGSVVIDPWGCIENQPGIAVIRIGRNGK